MVSKSKNYFSPMLICWNDIKIHLGFEDSYFVPPPTHSDQVDRGKNNSLQDVGQSRYFRMDKPSTRVGSTSA